MILLYNVSIKTKSLNARFLFDIFYNKIYKYNMDNFENYTIYELRNYARQVGVKSPTTKKRQDLLCEIEKINKGEIIPLTNNKKGRPCKNVNKSVLSDSGFKRVVCVDEEELKSILAEIKMLHKRLLLILDK